jgi:hypothetical protein
VLNIYPLFFAFAGFAASVLLYRRALALMQPDDKAALVDSSVFLGLAYLGLGARSVLRLRRLNLPARPARLLLMGNLAAVAGITLCAFILALRVFP